MSVEFICFRKNGVTKTVSVPAILQLIRTDDETYKALAAFYNEMEWEHTGDSVRIVGLCEQETAE